MSKESADHNDAELILKLYDLRRESVMRHSRDLLMSKFWPKTYDDLVAVTKPDNPLNAAYRQVSTYWEMAYSLANHGALNAELLVENGGEGLFLFAKVQPFVEQLRKEMNPFAFKNAEWIATQTDEGRKRFEVVKMRVAKMREALFKDK
jgi:hypothetical protein